jgi:hypothetical protein
MVKYKTEKIDGLNLEYVTIDEDNDEEMKKLFLKPKASDYVIVWMVMVVISYIMTVILESILDSTIVLAVTVSSILVFAWYIAEVVSG